MDMHSKGIILQHLISFIISLNYVFSCQFSEQWRSCSYYNLLFCCFSGDHDCHSNTTNILSVDIEEKTTIQNQTTNTIQFKWNQSISISTANIKCRTIHTFHCALNDQVSSAVKCYCASEYAVQTVILWLHSLYYRL